jgi:hypothetical protein
MGIRISEMEEATTFGADDYVPIVTNGTNKKALGAKIKEFIAGFFVSKSGDTMSGNLTVEKSNGEFVSKNPNVTINTTANNGVTSSQIEGVIVKDSADNNVARFLAFQETNGDVIAQIAAFNKKTDGTATNNYINATIKKDGTSSYTISNPAAFRSAIGANGISITEVNVSGTTNNVGYIATGYDFNQYFIGGRFRIPNSGGVYAIFRPSAQNKVVVLVTEDTLTRLTNTAIEGKLYYLNII